MTKVYKYPIISTTPLSNIKNVYSQHKPLKEGYVIYSDERLLFPILSIQSLTIDLTKKNKASIIMNDYAGFIYGITIIEK